MLDQETDDHDSATAPANENEEVTEIQNNTGTADLETQADTAADDTPAEQSADTTIYSQEGSDSESHPASSSPEESPEQTSTPADAANSPVPAETDSPAAPPASKSSYIKIPKKGLWISLAALLVIGIGVTLFIMFHRSSPAATVERAFEALKKNDSEAFCAEFNLSSTTQPYVRDMAKKMMSFLGGNFKDIEIVNEQTEDMKAVVTVNIIFDDNKTEQMDLHLVKIDDQWKIEPLGDLDFGLDSLFELGKKFGFGSGGSLQDDIGNILNNLF